MPPNDSHPQPPLNEGRTSLLYANEKVRALNTVTTMKYKGEALRIVDPKDFLGDAYLEFYHLVDNEWGVRTRYYADVVPPGRIITGYWGEVITQQIADTRNEQGWMVDLPCQNSNESLVVDGQPVNGMRRCFGCTINHCGNNNCRFEYAIADHQVIIIVVATEFIQPSTPLLLNYHWKSDNMSLLAIPCFCGGVGRCSGYLYDPSSAWTMLPQQRRRKQRVRQMYEYTAGEYTRKVVDKTLISPEDAMERAGRRAIDDDEWWELFNAQNDEKQEKHVKAQSNWKLIPLGSNTNLQKKKQQEKQENRRQRMLAAYGSQTNEPLYTPSDLHTIDKVLTSIIMDMPTWLTVSKPCTGVSDASFKALEELMPSSQKKTPPMRKGNSKEDLEYDDIPAPAPGPVSTRRKPVKKVEVEDIDLDDDYAPEYVPSVKPQAQPRLHKGSAALSQFKIEKKTERKKRDEIKIVEKAPEIKALIPEPEPMLEEPLPPLAFILPPLDEDNDVDIETDEPLGLKIVEIEEDEGPLTVTLDLKKSKKTKKGYVLQEGWGELLDVPQDEVLAPIKVFEPEPADELKFTIPDEHAEDLTIRANISTEVDESLVLKVPVSEPDSRPSRSTARKVTYKFDTLE